MFDNVDELIIEYIIAVFGERFDENACPYSYLYKLELQRMFSDLEDDLKTLEKFTPSLKTIRKFIRCSFLIDATNTYGVDIYSVDLMDKLAYKIAKQIVRKRTKE